MGEPTECVGHNTLIGVMFDVPTRFGVCLDTIQIFFLVSCFVQILNTGPSSTPLLHVIQPVTLYVSSNTCHDLQL